MYRSCPLCGSEELDTQEIRTGPTGAVLLTDAWCVRCGHGWSEEADDDTR